VLALGCGRVAVYERGVWEPATYDHHLIGVHDIGCASTVTELIGIASDEWIAFHPFERGKGKNVYIVESGWSAEPVAAVEITSRVLSADREYLQ